MNEKYKQQNQTPKIQTSLRLNMLLRIPLSFYTVCMLIFRVKSKFWTICEIFEVYQMFSGKCSVDQEYNLIWELDIYLSKWKICCSWFQDLCRKWLNHSVILAKSTLMIIAWSRPGRNVAIISHLVPKWVKFNHFLLIAKRTIFLLQNLEILFK